MESKGVVKNRPPFRKYCKILNSYDKNFLNDLKDYDKPCVATEKIHGSNFVFVSDGVDLWVGKRSSYLDEDARKKFFNTEYLIKEYGDKVRKLSEMCGNTVYVYGEQFGGIYPHPLTPSAKGVKIVQKGIYYCPNARFAPFDLYVVDKGFLSFNESRKLFEEVGFEDLPAIIARGTWGELLKLDVNNQQSRIPKRLGLPELEHNVWEGVVLRSDGDGHLMTKLKCEKYKEITSEKMPKEPLNVDECSEIIEMVKFYINQNRIDNMISKEGDNLHPRKLSCLVVRDAWDDFKSDHQDKFREYSKQDYKIKKFVNNQLITYCVKIYEENYLSK